MIMTFLDFSLYESQYHHHSFVHQWTSNKKRHFYAVLQNVRKQMRLPIYTNAETGTTVPYWPQTKSFLCNSQFRKTWHRPDILPTNSEHFFASSLISNYICSDTSNFRDPRGFMSFFGLGVFAWCARWIYWRRFGNRCGSWVRTIWLMTTEDGTHRGFRKVVSKFTSRTKQKPQNRKTIFIPRWKSKIRIHVAWRLVTTLYQLMLTMCGVQGYAVGPLEWRRSCIASGDSQAGNTINPSTTHTWWDFTWIPRESLPVARVLYRAKTCKPRTRTSRGRPTLSILEFSTACWFVSQAMHTSEHVFSKSFGLLCYLTA
jgi:hypothetical protein